MSDELRLTSQGVGVVHVRKDGGERAELKKLIAEWQVDRVVVGVPIKDDGTAGPTTPKAIAFAEALRSELSPMPVETWDESNTSVEANRILKERGIGWKESKQHVDRIAAAVMLQSWLDEHAVPSTPPGSSEPSIS